MAENANPTPPPAPPLQEVAAVVAKQMTTAPVANNKQDQILTPTSSVKRILFSLTTITFLLSFPIIFCVVWLIYMRHGDCEHILPLPKLQVGVVVGLVVLFVISNSVVLLRSRFLKLGLTMVMVPLVVILTIGSALIGAYKMETRMIPGSPAWLNMMVNNDTNWKAIESCIYDSRRCQDLAIQSSMMGSYDFSTVYLSPIESGCCIPPSVCDMQYVNMTFWEKKTGVYDVANGPYDIDCELWQNKVTKLCYECYSCRKGFIKTLRQKWYKLGVFLVVLTILLIVFHFLLFIVKLWEGHSS